ncbi:MAG: hypothetical protein FD169_566 [Bacillota bacterium]|nr:MAG: hypothetical protein FD169_566 [Bacillota bacterium]
MQSKVAKVNLEMGMPSVESALQTMHNALSTHKRQGTKAVILIHGYGSSGTGGGIKAAVRRALGDTSLRGIVRAYVGGENWTLQKREFIGICKSLDEHDRSLSANEGVTIVLLR